MGAKVPCPYGPADGDEGFRANVEYFRKAREAVGPDYPLMLDCYMALTTPYSIKLARALEPLGCAFKIPPMPLARARPPPALTHLARSSLAAAGSSG